MYPTACSNFLLPASACSNKELSVYTHYTSPTEEDLSSLLFACCLCCHSIRLLCCFMLYFIYCLQPWFSFLQDVFITPAKFAGIYSDPYVWVNIYVPWLTEQSFYLCDSQNCVLLLLYCTFIFFKSILHPLLYCISALLCFFNKDFYILS